MAALFDTLADNISLHLKNSYAEAELAETVDADTLLFTPPPQQLRPPNHLSPATRPLWLRKSRLKNRFIQPSENNQTLRAPHYKY
ncbi:hypothetical protein [Bordetella sp. BOR01]|uniref:hypothetical protein n=1 Tax=Bordetella sp. BOR01 TaxID=2854779 RepID=UPI001C46B0A2|nr:hypothetical protein [Bordetella sp. BOR01]MBV7481684.1 hypothetical protein [Bordetella sp. BOR01]